MAGIRFTPPGMTGQRGALWCPLAISVFTRTANRSTVIPAKAGIQYLGMDSGSSFHCARNDGGEEWLVSVPYQRIPSHGEPIHRHSRESGNPQYLGLGSWAPFHSARNDGAVGTGIRSLSAYSHARRTGPPSFPQTRESSTSAWIRGLCFIAPGMTGERGGCFLFTALPTLWAWQASCGFRPPPEGPSPFLSTPEFLTTRPQKRPLLWYNCSAIKQLYQLPRTTL